MASAPIRFYHRYKKTIEVEPTLFKAYYKLAQVLEELDDQPGLLRLSPGLGEHVTVDGAIHPGPALELTTTPGQRLVLRAAMPVAG